MKTKSQVIEIIKEILLIRLELEETGLSAGQIEADTLLLHGSGLGLDSVEALDLLIGVEKNFNLQLKNIDKAFLETTCYSVSSLADYVLNASSAVKDAG